MPEQQLATKEIFKDDPDLDESGFSLVRWLAGSGEVIPPWWSIGRDNALRNFWKSGDHISGTVNTLRDMLVAIPWKVLPRDATIKAHRRQAREFTSILLEETISRSNFTTQGWGSGYGPFIEDYHTQDNGGWMVVDNESGSAEKPLIGAATKLIHLDSARVDRRRNKEFPITYTDWDGKMHKIHESRVIGLTSMSTPPVEMLGVGFCATSRAIQIAQNLIDISNYKLEKLGSRPLRAMMTVPGGNRNAIKAIEKALSAYAMMADTKDLVRYAPTPIIGLPAGATIDLTNFASLPDGFNELESVQLGMGVLALAFGVDVRQLGFALGVAGQTKADATIQHLKMRGKGPGAVLQETRRMLDSKFLPAHLMAIPDWQDDQQDEMKARIDKTRSETRKANLETGSTTVRVEREQMVKTGELTEQQFAELEIGESRLSDGTDILALFESTDRKMIELLDLGIDDPRDVEMNDPAIVLPEIKAAMADIEESILRNRDLERNRQAFAALEALEVLYQKPEAETEAVRLSPQQLISVTSILRDVTSGDTGEETAVDLITSIGITEERARRMVANAKGGKPVEEIIEEVADGKTQPATPGQKTTPETT